MSGRLDIHPVMAPGCFLNSLTPVRGKSGSRHLQAKLRVSDGVAQDEGLIWVNGWLVLDFTRGHKLISLHTVPVSNPQRLLTSRAHLSAFP